jgi:hypothetical protein
MTRCEASGLYLFRKAVNRARSWGSLVRVLKYPSEKSNSERVSRDVDLGLRWGGRRSKSSSPEEGIVSAMALSVEEGFARFSGFFSGFRSETCDFSHSFPSAWSNCGGGGVVWAGGGGVVWARGGGVVWAGRGGVVWAGGGGVVWAGGGGRALLFGFSGRTRALGLSTFLFSLGIGSA